MRVGFTGTRDGMTRAQQITVNALLSKNRPEWVHHGDCVGADAEFHYQAQMVGAQVKIHPPSDPKLRACMVADEIAEEKPYLERNRDIVDACDRLIATPKESSDRLKGGTWYTINYARRLGRPVTVVWPDGTTRIDGLGEAT